MKYYKKYLLQKKLKKSSRSDLIFIIKIKNFGNVLRKIILIFEKF